MEDDDEFGDLYTDVLTALPAPIKSPIIDDQIIPKSPKQTLAPEHHDLNEVHKIEHETDVDVIKVEETSLQNPNSVDVIKVEETSFQNLNSTDIIKEENLEKFDIEVDSNGEIPGVSGNNEDWDSDSEDDLQIVLNDNGHGMTGMGDDDDEDGLLIVADDDPIGNCEQIEEDWGEDVGQGGEGEAKEVGGVAPVAKFGFGGHNYHPYQSPFKYVRPGAAPMPGVAPVAPGGAPGQLRPPVNMGPFTGRGRGDWRPTGMQRTFFPGHAPPAWGNIASGRGFGTGLDFTLPSHKTIFEVDVDSFEEKPWRLVGIDVSDFFNFELNEETWKDYCKQLEQLRLESTMQSKIRVYESGRTEQEYDPDMPPELAAAACIHDVSSENVIPEKADGGQSDLAKGFAPVRPQLPIGSAIQVETGYGERLPSIDTRPPRIRHPDAIIEIVLQDFTEDNESIPGNDMAELPTSDPSGEDLNGGLEKQGTEISDRMPQACIDSKREAVRRRAPLKNSVNDKTTEGAPIPILPYLAENPVQNCLDSRGQSSGHTGHNISGPLGDRWTMEHDRSPTLTSGRSTQDKIFLYNQKEESAESVDGKPTPPSSSPVSIKVQQESRHDEIVLADGSSDVGREKIALDTTPTHFLKDKTLMYSVKKRKLNSQLEHPSLQENDDDEDLKGERSSKNSKSISGSSREYHHYRDGVEEEVVQDGRSTHTGIINGHPGDGDRRNVRRKVHDSRQDMQRNHLPMKGREDLYYRKNWDSNSAHYSHKKTGSIDRGKECDNSNGALQRRDEGPHGRRSRAEDVRKREHRSKVQEKERIDTDSKDEYQPRKQMDNSSWRGDRDENLKTRNEHLDDLQSNRRKEKVHVRRDHAEKEENPIAHRESSNRRKRERDDTLDHIPNKEDMLDQRKRDDSTRPRNDDQRSVSHKEEGWSQKERVERQIERDEWRGLKQSREASLPKRESRSVRTAEDKARVHSRVKDEYKGSNRDYHFNDKRRHTEQPKSKDRVGSDRVSIQKASEDVFARGAELHNEERKSRQERGSARSDRAINVSDNNRVHEKKHRENPRKSKERDGGHKPSASSRRNQEDHSGQTTERVKVKGMIEQGNSDAKSLKKHKEDASSDDEQQDSRRGRSKLERWTSHKERDFSILCTKPPSSSSLNVRENISNNRHADESPKAVEVVIEDAHPVTAEVENNNTVEKLKKRSQRFKLPMPTENEAIAIEKMENESLLSSQTETTHTDSDVKHERPPRKRRWTGN